MRAHRLRWSAQSATVAVGRRRRRSSIARCEHGCRDSSKRSVDFRELPRFRARNTGDGKWTFPAHASCPQSSPKALKAISRTIPALDFTIATSRDLAKEYNPFMQGWINCYGPFRSDQCMDPEPWLDVSVIRWAAQVRAAAYLTTGARNWLDRLVVAEPDFREHWRLSSWQRSNIGSRLDSRSTYGSCGHPRTSANAIRN